MNRKLAFLSVSILVWGSLGYANGQPAAAAAAGAGAGAAQYAASAQAGAQTADKDAKQAHDEHVGVYNIPNVRYIEYSPNGKWVAVASTSRRDQSYLLQIFAVNAQTGLWNRQASSFLKFDNISAIAFFPNSLFLAVAWEVYGYLNIYSIDQNRGALHQTNPPSDLLNGDSITTITFSPNGTLFATRSLNKMHLASINPQTGKLTSSGISHTVSTNYSGFGTTGRALSFSSDGSLLITSDLAQNTFAVFKVLEHPALSLTKILDIPLKEGSLFSLFMGKEWYCIPNSNLIIVNEISIKPMKQNGQGIWIDEQGTGIQVFALKTENQKTILIPIDSLKFEVQFEDVGSMTSYFEYSGETVAQAYFNKNLVAMFQDYKKNIIHLVSIDTQTGKIRPFVHSPFVLENEESIQHITFSSDNSVLTAVFKNSVQLYEIDESAGTLTPLTGQPLHNPFERHKKAAEALGNGTQPILPPAIIHGPLYEYVVGPKPVQEKQIIEDTQEKMLHDAVAKTKKQRETKDADAAILFKIIKESKDDPKSIEQYLTPFTINARNEERKTPLMVAAYYRKTNIALRLLGYEGEQYDSEFAQHKVIVKPDIQAIDSARNTAAAYAKIHGNQKLLDALTKASEKPH